MERELLLFMDIEKIILSSTKSPKRVTEAPAIASVIRAEEISAIGARNLLDVLKRVPGIGVSIIHGMGEVNIESRGIRGQNSEKILLLMDGHRLNDIVTGGATWSFEEMMVENIKRIEIIKGPGSALHGANAFVGVINVVTKDGGDIDGVVAHIGRGNLDREHYNLMFGKKDSNLRIAATLDYIDTDGASSYVKSDFIGLSGHASEWKEKAELALKLSYGNLFFNGKYLDKKRGDYVGVKNVLNDESRMDVNHLFGEVKFEKSLSEDLNLQVKGYYDRFEWWAKWEIFPEDILAGFPDGMIGIPETKTRTIGTEIQVDYNLWEGNSLTMGAIYEDVKQFDVKHNANINPWTGDPLGSVQDITSWANWNRNMKRYVSAFYLQDIWQFAPGIEATLGVRHDHYNDFGDTTNPRFGLVWNIQEGLTAKLLYGSAFRAPNFLELYNDSNPVDIGNPDLNPEKIDTYEASIHYQFQEKYSTILSYFKSDIKDIINLQGGTYYNLGRVKVDGIEAEIKALFNKLSYGYINYTYQNPQNKFTGEKLSGVSKHKGNVGFNVAFGSYINANMNLLVVGSRSRSNTDLRDDLDGYEVADLALTGKNFYEGLEVRLSTFNLFDQDYADPSSENTIPDDYPRPGRTFMLDATYKF